MKRYITLSITALCILLYSSCTTKFDEYNTNPNEAERGTISALNMLEELLYSSGEAMVYRTWQLNGELIQYTVSGTGTNAYHRYMIPNTVQSSTWAKFAQCASNAEEMRRLAVKNEEPNCEAIAITMKALMLANITDCYGDIPYTEAFGNLDAEHNNQPKFDTQRDVYEGLLSDLEYANSLYDQSDALASPKRDLMYGGDLVKWQKFTNSLYLRLLMRLSNRDAQMGVSTKIAEIYANSNKYPVFDSIDDNATLYYTTEDPFTNYFGDTASSSFTSSRKACAQIINMMLEPGDPRISVMFKQTSEQWKGMESGQPAQDMEVDGISTLNRDNLGASDSPYSFMKYDEVLFIYAEAVKRGWISGGDVLAGDLYKQAVTASVKWWNSIDKAGTIVTDTTISNFLAKAPYNNTLEQILNQKYIALFWTGYEAWHEWRRTGYPELVIGSGTINDHTLPTRFQYPDNTANVNIGNYQIQVARLQQVYGGGDDMKTPVWWSKAAAQQGIE